MVCFIILCIGDKIFKRRRWHRKLGSFFGFVCWFYIGIPTLALEFQICMGCLHCKHFSRVVGLPYFYIYSRRDNVSSKVSAMLNINLSYNCHGIFCFLKCIIITWITTIWLNIKTQTFLNCISEHKYYNFKLHFVNTYSFVYIVIFERNGIECQLIFSNNLCYSAINAEYLYNGFNQYL